MRAKISRAFSILGALAFVLGASVMMMMMRQGFSARPDPSALEARLATAARSFAVPARYRNLKNPVASDSKVLEASMAHWADHCASCHGNDGAGANSMAKMMYPRPPDLRAAPTQGQTDGELYYAINQGIRLTGMPAWGTDGEADLDSWALVAFIRTLPELTPAQLEAMKALNPVPASVVKARQEEDDFLNGP